MERIDGVGVIDLQRTQRNHTYTYDPAGRLTAHDVDGARTEWTFDANGNRTHENGTEIARYDAEDRLIQWRDNNYTCTPAGDLQSRTNPSGTTTYTYDALGSLHQVTLPGGTRIDYVIDPQGRRIGKKKNGALQYGLLYQDALNPIAELGPDGRIRSVFLYAEHAHAPAAMVRDGKLYRFVTDHLGSIRVVIDTTTGTIAQQLDYDVWGKVTLDTQPGFQPFGFAGGVYDADTGLTRFGARDYDGETGRWTSKDPIRFKGGDTNLYGYTFSDPVNFTDPSGLAPPGRGSDLCKALLEISRNANNTFIDGSDLYTDELSTEDLPFGKAEHDGVDVQYLQVSYNMTASGGMGGAVGLLIGVHALSYYSIVMGMGVSGSSLSETATDMRGTMLGFEIAMYGDFRDYVNTYCGCGQ